MHGANRRFRDSGTGLQIQIWRSRDSGTPGDKTRRRSRRPETGSVGLHWSFRDSGTVKRQNEKAFPALENGIRRCALAPSGTQERSSRICEKRPRHPEEADHLSAFCSRRPEETDHLSASVPGARKKQIICQLPFPASNAATSRPRAVIPGGLSPATAPQPEHQEER